MALVVDPELKALIPPLTDEEYRTLEESILDEGVRDPITVWDGVIVDGHNRYEIATKHGIIFNTSPMRFIDKDDCKVWMIDNQRGRRNLSAGAWAELGLKRASLKEAQAKANKATFTGNQYTTGESLKLDSDQKIDTLSEAAKYSGLSRATVAKAKKVYESDNEELKQAVRTGKKKINAAYQEIKKPAGQVWESGNDEAQEEDRNESAEGVDTAATESQEQIARGQKHARTIIQLAEKLLQGAHPTAKDTMICELGQWVETQRNSK